MSTKKCLLGEFEKKNCEALLPISIWELLPLWRRVPFGDRRLNRVIGGKGIAFHGSCFAGDLYDYDADS